MIQQALTIARNTFTESIRQPIFAVLILVGAAAMVLNQQLAAYTFTDDNKLLIDMCLSSIFLIGLLLAAFTATGVLSSEIENRTVLTVVSKPVARPTFVLGKFLGVAGAIAVAYYILVLFIVFALRQRVMTTASDHIDWPVVLFAFGGGLVALGLATAGNYMFRWVFASSFVLTLAVVETLALLMVLLIDKDWHFQSPLAEFVADGGQLTQVLVGLVLVFEAVLILTAVAITASTRLGQIATLLICLGVFFIGLVSNSLSAWTNDLIGLAPDIGPGQSLLAIFTADISWGMMFVCLLAKLTYLVLPNLQFLWPADAITQGNPFSLSHVATVTGYAALYITVVLCVAVSLFQTREVG